MADQLVAGCDLLAAAAGASCYRLSAKSLCCTAGDRSDAGQVIAVMSRGHVGDTGRSS